MRFRARPDPPRSGKGVRSGKAEKVSGTEAEKVSGTELLERRSVPGTPAGKPAASGIGGADLCRTDPLLASSRSPGKGRLRGRPPPRTSRRGTIANAIAVLGRLRGEEGKPWYNATGLSR